MKFFKISVALIFLISFAVLSGCGGDSTTKDDSDVSKTMKKFHDKEYFVLTRLVDLEPGEEISEDISEEIKEKEDEEEPVVYHNTKYTSHTKDLVLTDEGEDRPVYAVMEVNESDIEYKSIDNAFYVVFETGEISLIVADNNLLDETVTKANILEEELLCPHKLKKGVEWKNDNGTYGCVERYEYVVLDAFKRTAPSFKITTYTDETKTEVLKKVWWCPDLGWYVQWQDFKKLTADYLTEINFDWEDEY